MATGFGDVTGFDHEDAVGVRHSVQPVSDRQCGAALAKVLHGFTYLQFGLGIEGGGRLVEQDD